MRVGASSSDVLSVEIIALALADAVRNRGVVGWAHGDRFCGGVAATVGIRSRNGVVARTTDGYRRVSGGIAPRIRVRTSGGKRYVVSLAEATVTADAHIRQRIHRHRDACGCRAALRVGGGNGIDTALANANVAIRTTIVPKVGDPTIGGKGSVLVLAEGGVARNGWSRRRG